MNKGCIFEGQIGGMAWAIHELGHGRAAARGRGSTNVGQISDEELQNISLKLYHEMRPLEFVFERPKLN